MLRRFLGAAALRRAEALLAKGDRAAIPWLARAAQAELPAAQWRLACCYGTGILVPRSQAEARNWLTRAAAGGHAQAQVDLAKILLQGEAAGTGLFETPIAAAPDLAAARTWAERAAGAGSAAGKTLLAYMLTLGADSQRDPARAEALYAEAAPAWPQAALGLALIRRANGHAPETIRPLLAQAATAGLPTALALLAEMEELGKGGPRDPQAAARNLAQAAEAGHTRAQGRYGRMLLAGLGVARDPLTGETWLRRAALAGDRDAAAALGDLYAGHGSLPPNHAEAALWYRRAVERGHAPAARALGLLHLAGSGAPHDKREAAHLLRLAAEGGEARAVHDLAAMAARGETDDEMARFARERLAMLAEAGDLVAAYNLGAIAADGIGGARDDTLAALWLRRAAGALSPAQLAYGRLLLAGRVAGADAATGRRWLALAARTEPQPVTTMQPAAR